ncbi:MAG: hypothetical protein ACREP7_12335 [Lysobacter sp.]
MDMRNSPSHAKQKRKERKIVVPRSVSRNRRYCTTAGSLSGREDANHDEWARNFHNVSPYKRTRADARYPTFAECAYRGSFMNCDARRKAERDDGSVIGAAGGDAIDR